MKNIVDDEIPKHRKQHVKRELVIEYRYKQEVWDRIQRGYVLKLFRNDNSWHVWQRYAKEKDRVNALARLSRHSMYEFRIPNENH